MGLPRTFVGFSSTDLHYYQLMKAWKQSENIDFNFTDSTSWCLYVKKSTRVDFSTARDTHA